MSCKISQHIDWTICPNRCPSIWRSFTACAIAERWARWSRWSCSKRTSPQASMCRISGPSTASCDRCGRTAPGKLRGLSAQSTHVAEIVGRHRQGQPVHFVDDRTELGVLGQDARSCFFHAGSGDAKFSWFHDAPPRASRSKFLAITGSRSSRRKGTRERPPFPRLARRTSRR